MRKPVRKVIIQSTPEGDIGLVPLANGYCAMIDVEDIPEIGKYNWYQNRQGYVIRKSPRPSHRNIFMHRDVIKPPDDKVVDHIDGNPLNNKRSNLRPCTHSQNLCNRGKEKGNRSGYKGVNWAAANRKWRAEIRFNNVLYHLGVFANIEDARTAYVNAAKKLHGEFARLD